MHNISRIPYQPFEKPENPNSNLNSDQHVRFPPPPPPQLQNNFPPHFFNQRPNVPNVLSQQQCRPNFSPNIPPPFNLALPPPPPNFQCSIPPFFPNNQAFPPRQHTPVEYTRNPGHGNFINLHVPPPSLNNNVPRPVGMNLPATNATIPLQSEKDNGTVFRHEQGPKQIGQQLLENWLKDKSKVKKGTCDNQRSSENNKLWTWMNQLRELMQILTSMSTQVQYLSESYSSIDRSSWDKSVCDFEKLKRDYSACKVAVEDEVVEQHETALKQIQKKRKRQSRKRMNDLDHQLNISKVREEKNKQIDLWQERIQAKIKEENLRKARKEAADLTLSKVSKEIQDATRLIETMLSLKKLRLIRRDAAQKRGDTELGESRQSFEDKISDMTRLVQAQLECYKEEEARLKEVIRSEQNEKQERERLLQATNKKLKEKEEEDKLQSLLFGPKQDVSTTDPLYPFIKFYSQAEDNLQAFIQIRREWDLFIVADKTPASSVVPMSWVIPDAPSSLAWAQALK
ncbi:programmed cell death protein 7 [Biomphalaria pfeifferi]|uniref:Programmed cell death protein 7 n=1 Tax=Biomphalaria pfeifferi TaxID=112525 RepID=A0AAD8BH75_BIOPF|nr:programmed cell death protein 7 [Biomphalaria pfeifferi]